MRESINQNPILFQLIILIAVIFLLVLSACQGNGSETEDEDDDDGSSSISFPHPDGWEGASSHGLFTLELYTAGTDASLGETCQGCHGENLRGNGDASSCYECHDYVPKPSGWMDQSSSDFHGLQATDGGILENCGTSCHGTDLTGGISDTSCYTCHDVGMHLAENPNLADYFTSSTSEWSDYNVHGAYVIDTDAITSGTCATSCHGTDYLGGLSEISCMTCHTSYPHSVQSDNWSTDHMAYVSSNTDASCTTTNGCHTNKNPGPSTVNPSCTDFCHQ